MQLNLTVKQIMDIISMCNHSEYATAILDGTQKEYESQYPKINDTVLIYDTAQGRVSRVDIPNNRIEVKGKQVIWYSTSEYNDEDSSSYKSGKYCYPCATDKDDIYYYDIKEFQSVCTIVKLEHIKSGK